MCMKTRYVYLFIVICSVLLLNPGNVLSSDTELIPGSGPLTLTLSQVQEYAVTHSTGTMNARLDVKAARKKIWETTAIGLPQVNGKISYQDMTQMPVTLIPAEFIDPDAEPGTFSEMVFGTQHNASLEVTATQLVFSGSYIVALQASKTYLQLIKNSLSKSEIDVKETVSNTYYLILMAEKNLKTLKTSLANLKETHSETQEMFKAGFVADTDVDQVQLAVTDLENSVRSMERQVIIAYRLLKFQMGMDLQQEIRLADNLDTIVSGLETKKMLDAPFDLDRHIDYRILVTQEKSQKLLLKKEISEYLPTISAFATHQKNAMRDSFNFFSGGKWFPTTIIGLNVDIPIFSSGQRAAKVAQAKIELKKVRNSKREVARGLQVELMQARHTFADALEKMEKTRENVTLAKKIYDKTTVKFQEGMSSSLDLIQTHNQYLTAESNYTGVVVELLNAKTRLDKILSRL